MSKLTDLATLSAAVPSGARLAVGGFQLSRVPVTLLQALVARGTRRLAVICAPNPWALETLAAGNALRHADCGFIGFQYEGGFVIPPALRQAIAAGEATLEQRDVFDTIEELRRPTGTPRVDFALLHAQRGDRHGNLRLDDPYADVVLAGGAARVLATVEKIVDSVDAPTIGGDRVDAVAEIPGGAAPTACYGHYGRNVRAIDDWLEQCGQRRPTGQRETATRPERSEGADAFIVNLARQVRNDEVVVTGLASAVPMLAIGLAQRLHAPRARYINCVGAVNPRLGRCWPTSVEPALLGDCESTLDLPDLFDLARDGGVDAMFFGAAQIDAAGNINLSHIGKAGAPRVRLPGPAGSPSMRSFVRRVLISIPRQSERNLVASVDDVTSAPAPENQETILITDLGRWELYRGRFRPRGLCGHTDFKTLVRRCGFAPGNAVPAAMDPPTELELAALRRLDPDDRRYRLLGVRSKTRRRRDRTKALLHER